MTKRKKPTQPYSRRRFLEFMGRGSAFLYAYPVLSSLSSCKSETAAKAGNATDHLFRIPSISPSAEDRLLLADGLEYEIIVKWDDPIDDDGLLFGEHSDYLAFLPFEKGNSEEGLLWVNHEYFNPLFATGNVPNDQKTKEQVMREMACLGGSIIHVRRDAASGKWIMAKSAEHNKRITGLTPIEIIADRDIAGSRQAIGTFANCAGGVTPWGHILTCEENYQYYYGERDFTKGDGSKSRPGSYGWERHFDYPPEHYGWVVEVNPKTGAAKKLTGMGRCAHECATVRLADDGRCAVYSADDANDQCLYKFIADEPGSLEKGTLYVASLEQGKWLPLDLEQQPVLKSAFKDKTEMLIRLREAAKLIGGTPLDRPEDVEIDPVTGSVIIALTNNVPKGNYFGSLLRISEKNNNPLSLEFESDTYLAGGPENGFASPDNLAFDPKGNLWITTDMSGSVMHKEPYTAFRNNGLFVVPMSGPDAGKPIQVASAPVDAELTGPYFTPDGKTLFLAVQHPGEMTENLDNFTSHWPDGGNQMPRSSVVAITGSLLEKLMS